MKSRRLCILLHKQNFLFVQKQKVREADSHKKQNFLNCISDESIKEAHSFDPTSEFSDAQKVLKTKTESSAIVHTMSHFTDAEDEILAKHWSETSGVASKLVTFLPGRTIDQITHHTQRSNKFANRLHAQGTSHFLVTHKHK
jgi:hypothetical protein